MQSSKMRLTQWAQIDFSTLNQHWFNVEPQLSSTILNVDIWLRDCWFCNNDQPKINFSTTIQPKINQVWSWNISVEKWLKSGWQLVDFWFILGWEVDFWLIIVTKSTISQPNIKVDISLRNWYVPIGEVMHMPTIIFHIAIFGILNATYCRQPRENLLVSSRDTSSEEIFPFVCLYLKSIFAGSDSFSLITSHLKTVHVPP